MLNHVIEVPAWQRGASPCHGFGESPGAASGDPPYPELAWALGLSPLNIITARQVHETSVLIADQPGVTGQADIIITDQPGLLLGIRTADCVPLLLWESGTTVAAAVHAGWRGTAARVAEIGVNALMKTYGAKPARICGAVGPSIGPCCYEVGPEVVDAMEKSYAPPLPIRHTEGDRFLIDLKALNRRALLAAGLPAEQIHLIKQCTHCNPDRFHSYRRDGAEAGRQLSFIGAL